MEKLQEFEIPITGSKNSKAEFSFEIGPEFFSSFENSLLKEGDLNAKVELEKSDTLIDAKFEIWGDLRLTCDRSLEEFDQPISIEKEHVFKYGDHEEEYSEEITLIPFESSSINIGQLIYEFIGLEVPFRKVHPRFRNPDGSEMDFEFKAEAEEKKEIDPRWEELKKIRN